MSFSFFIISAIKSVFFSNLSIKRSSFFSCSKSILMMKSKVSNLVVTLIALINQSFMSRFKDNGFILIYNFINVEFL